MTDQDKRYFELTEVERGQLSSEEVELLCTLELAHRGYSWPDAPQYEDEGHAEAPQTEFFAVSFDGRYGDEQLSLIFRSEADALTVMAMTDAYLDDYCPHAGISRHAKKLQNMRLSTARLPTEQDANDHSEAAGGLAAVKEANKKLRDTYENEVDVCRRIREEIWEDYRDRVTEERARQITRKTWSDLLEVAGGDADRAASFVRKREDFDEDRWREAVPDFPMLKIETAGNEIINVDAKDGSTQ